MSRIGRLPIPIESGVKIAQDGDTVTVQGPKGTLAHTLPRGISIAIALVTCGLFYAVSSFLANQSLYQGIFWRILP